MWAWGPSTGPTACALASRRCALWGWREGVPGGGGCLAPLSGASEFRRSPSPGCPSSGRAVGVRCPRAVGADVRAWVCHPFLGRAAGRGCVWCVWCLSGVFVLVGAWWCGVCRGAVVRGAASLRLSPWCPPLLRYLVVLCLPWLVAVPPSPRVSLARLLATLLLPSLLRRSLPFPLLSVGPPSSLGCIFPCLRPCVCLGFFLCLLPRSRGTPPSLLLGAARQKKGGGVGHCGGGGTDDDVAAAAVSPNVVCVCVVVSRFFSIPLARPWRPMRAWVGIGCLVTRSQGVVALLALACRIPRSCLWAPGIPLGLLVCACFFAVACTHTIHFYFRGVGGLLVRDRFSSSSLRLGPGVICCGLLLCRKGPVGGRQCGGGVGGGSFVFLCAGWVVCRVSLPFPALSLLLLGFRRPTCLFMLLWFFCWRRPWSFVFSIPGRVACIGALVPLVLACGSLRAFVHLRSFPASFSLLVPSYLFATPRRLLLRVFIRLRDIPCFACGAWVV